MQHKSDLQRESKRNIDLDVTQIIVALIGASALIVTALINMM